MLIYKVQVLAYLSADASQADEIASQSFVDEAGALDAADTLWSFLKQSPAPTFAVQIRRYLLPDHLDIHHVVVMMNSGTFGEVARASMCIWRNGQVVSE